MSSDYYRRQALQHQQEIARLQREKGSAAGRVADAQRKANSATQSASRASSLSSANSYLRDAQRYQEEVAREQKKIADIEDKIAREQGRLNDASTNQARDEEREQKDRQREEERRLRDSEQRMRHITSKLTHHDVLHQHTLSALERLAQLPERIVVLFMASNPLDQPQLRLDEEARAIAEMIRKSEHRDAVKFESCWAVRPLDLLQAINEFQPRIVHFSGHGSDQSEIVFQDQNGQAKLVSKEAIVQTMAAASGDIQVVFFNTCYSRDQAEAVVRHIPAAIGMNASIGDDAARVFAAQFYSTIGFGLSVRRAFDQAKAALMLENIPEEKTPELFVATGVDSDALVLVKPPITDLQAHGSKPIPS
jgi:hypothetical protein